MTLLLTITLASRDDGEKMRDLRLQVFANVCSACELEFESLHSLDDYGGEVLYGNAGGDLQFLDPDSDRVWQEVASIVDGVTSGRTLRDIERAELFHHALARSLDVPVGGPFASAWVKRPCPRCGSTRRAFFGPANPPRFAVTAVREVSHDRWNALTTVEKEAEVRRGLLAAEEG